MNVIEGVFYAGNAGRVKRLLVDNKLPCISVGRTLSSLSYGNMRRERDMTYLLRNS